jgi:MFS family permease
MLEQRQFTSHWVPAVMTIGQISEFPALLLLPLCLKRLGMKTTFAIGMAAWLLRYAAFAMDLPEWILLTGISLHGICHVFLIIVIQLYVDSQCPSDVRASAQNLFAFITMGIAMPVGFVLSGAMADWCTPVGGATNYKIFFGAPAILVLLLLLAFCRWFRLVGGKDPQEADKPTVPLNESVP